MSVKKVQPGVWAVLTEDLEADHVSALIILKSSTIGDLSNRGGFNYVYVLSDGGAAPFQTFTCMKPNPLNTAANENFGGDAYVPCDYATLEECIAAYEANEFAVEIDLS